MHLRIYFFASHFFRGAHMFFSFLSPSSQNIPTPYPLPLPVFLTTQYIIFNFADFFCQSLLCRPKGSSKASLTSSWANGYPTETFGSHGVGLLSSPRLWGGGALHRHLLRLLADVPGAPRGLKYRPGDTGGGRGGDGSAVLILL